MPPTNEPKKKEDVKKDDKKKDKKKDEKEDELSEEDLKKKEELELLVVRAQDPQSEIQKAALEAMRKEIKDSTSSMTSVPKPLKFLRPHYDTLKNALEKTTKPENKALHSDILSVLAMTMATADSRESLKFKLKGDIKDPGSWGHEYVRSLSGEIAREFDDRRTKEESVDDLYQLVDEIVPFDMQHNAEHEACDLLAEVEQIEKIIPFIDENNYARVCLYLSNYASYVPEPEDSQILKIVQKLYSKVKQWPDAMRIAMKLNDQEQIKTLFTECTDPAIKRQLAFMLARQHIFLESEDEPELNDIINNTNLTQYFLALAQDLDITEAKTPDDIYKTNLSDTRGFSANVDSARQNLASTFVNAFVNAAYGQDKLVTTEDGNKWLYKNKEHGMMSAAASLGMVLLWDVDGGLTQIDKYMYATEDFVKAGALLAVGIVNSGVRNDCDPALALLSDYIDKPSNALRIGAILGLGLAYNGSARQDLLDSLLPMIDDSNTPMEVAAIAAVSLGMIFVGTAHPDITQSIMQALMERDEASLSNTHSRFMALGLGLAYLGKQDMADVTLETLKILENPIGKYASLTVETCAYIGSGNVLKVQKLLDMSGDHLDDKATWQGLTVLGIAMIAMGEEVGTEMAIRSFDHILQYGEPIVRRAVPLALGLLNISNPKVTVMDTLSKLSHDSDEEVSLSAIFALGLIGAGTNNSRVANMLRSLATYYYKEANHLFMVRVSQGLVYMGKGTMTLAPYHSDRTLLSPTAIAGLLVTLHSCLDIKNIILGKSHYLLFTLVTAMYPRMLMTFDEKMKPLPVSVRVGQAVDTVGLAGRPKTITGFQTHNTPVLLGYGDRAELATDEYIQVTSIMEGFVILKPNPDYKPTEEKDKKK
eukprot:TRINITY_DN1017_c0_g1_i1.p1 TRINITY_DN1017_c0_g1~~TRINITY_DN1017_c0_g1_i1.p1  ORF type:complete len:876 (+),score=310.73 TRINITY_DN1017_c0_g1_i1:43-2670(+)